MIFKGNIHRAVNELKMKQEELEKVGKKKVVLLARPLAIGACCRGALRRLLSYITVNSCKRAKRNWRLFCAIFKKGASCSSSSNEDVLVTEVH